MNTSAASGSMREIEHETDVIFLLGANTTESHPVFGAAIAVLFLKEPLMASRVVAACMIVAGLALIKLH